MNRDNAISLGIGLLGGAIIGGIIALVYAPRSGQQTIHLIKDKATEMVDTVRKEADEVMDTVKGAASEASRKGQAVAQAIKN